MRKGAFRLHDRVAAHLAPAKVVPSFHAAAAAEGTLEDVGAKLRAGDFVLECGTQRDAKVAAIGKNVNHAEALAAAQREGGAAAWLPDFIGKVRASYAFDEVLYVGTIKPALDRSYKYRNLKHPVDAAIAAGLAAIAAAEAAAEAVDANEAFSSLFAAAASDAAAGAGAAEWVVFGDA
jgi:hypothetical protein